MNIIDDKGDGYKSSYLTVIISLENGAEEVLAINFQFIPFLLQSQNEQKEC